MTQDPDSAHIRGPFEGARTTEQLLKASVQVQQLILAELTAPPVRKDHSEAILVLLSQILGELQHMRKLLDPQVMVENDNE